VVRHKGELNPGRIDAGWPYQVALHAEAAGGRNTVIIQRFCNGLSLCPRRQHYRKDGVEHLVFCFATKHDAEFFHVYFGGELMTPETRPPRYPKVPRRAI
jgi:hypothetical protein